VQLAGAGPFLKEKKMGKCSVTFGKSLDVRGKSISTLGIPGAQGFCCFCVCAGLCEFRNARIAAIIQSLRTPFQEYTHTCAKAEVCVLERLGVCRSMFSVPASVALLLFALSVALFLCPLLFFQQRGIKTCH